MSLFGHTHVEKGYHMNFGEDFFYRHDRVLRLAEELLGSGRREKTPAALEREAKRDEAFLEELRAWRDHYRENISREKVERYLALAKEAYAMARRMHYNIDISDTNDFSADIVLQTDSVRFLRNISVEEKAIFMRLIEASDIFVMEPDGDLLNICFTFNLSSANGQ